MLCETRELRVKVSQMTSSSAWKQFKVLRKTRELKKEVTVVGRERFEPQMASETNERSRTSWIPSWFGKYFQQGWWSARERRSKCELGNTNFRAMKVMFSSSKFKCDEGVVWQYYSSNADVRSEKLLVWGWLKGENKLLWKSSVWGICKKFRDRIHRRLRNRDAEYVWDKGWGIGLHRKVLKLLELLERLDGEHIFRRLPFDNSTYRF